MQAPAHCCLTQALVNVKLSCYHVAEWRCRVQGISAYMQKESWIRLAARAALLPWPGFSDHFPCEYEIALRQELGFSP